MNVIAGILIGIANDTWFSRLIIPFVWGIVFCFYTSILSKDREKVSIEIREMRGKKAKWGMSHFQAFYFIEYITAAFTSLIFSIGAGFVKGFF